MDMIVNEFCKLRRTYITIVAVAIPLVSVVFGAGGYFDSRVLHVAR